MISDSLLIKLRENSEVISDLIRAALFEKDEKLFDLLDFEDDRIFLEQSLFCYFLSDIPQNSKLEIEQCLWGYIPEIKQTFYLNVRSDNFGWINLPNLGFIKSEPNKNQTLNKTYINEKLISNLYIPNSRIRLSFSPTEHLVNQKQEIIFDEPIINSFEKHRAEIESATLFFQIYAPKYWKGIELVTREIVVFSSPDYYSFAGIMQHGTAYLNIENTRKIEVFFIDDIAHQCGHIIFNTLTYDFENYLKVPKDSPLNKYYPNPQEMRGVYGSFHGLYTYSSILYSLDIYLEKKKSSNKYLKHEAIGRIGFYLHKFEYDLALLGGLDIFTSLGRKLYDEFELTFIHIQDKWKSHTINFDYSNQPYIFQYDHFLQYNPIL